VQVRANPDEWDGYGPLPPKPTLEQMEDVEAESRPATHSSGRKSEMRSLRGHWNMRLTSFQRLVFIKTFEEEKVNYLIATKSQDKPSNSP